MGPAIRQLDGRVVPQIKHAVVSGIAVHLQDASMRSIARLMGVKILMLDFATLSRRGMKLPEKPQIKGTEAIHLTVDKTGLRIFGEGE